MARELIIDSFAGGGGTSLGIEQAVGRSPDIAINHDAAAIAMHAANHPATKHLTEDVWHVDMRKLVGRRRVGLLWASPDCKHFSRAKGSVPVNKNIRSLAWVIVKWASQVKPRVIILENVREFQDWGPLVQMIGTDGAALTMPDGRPKLKPCPARKGTTFRLFCNRLRGFGYQVECRTLDAADYGAPTHRRRLFLVARRDGSPIIWPEPTHCDPKKISDRSLFAQLQPYRTAAECIDWSVPCPSIFERKRPLADATMRRIAMGIKRYVLDNPTPFIVRFANGEGAGSTKRWGHGSHSIDEPLPTSTAKGRFGLAAPVLVRYNSEKSEGDNRCEPIDDPASTLDTQNRLGIVAPILVGAGGSVYSAKPTDIDRPKNAVLPNDRSALVSAFCVKHFGGVVGCSIDTPLPTTTERGTQNQIVAANLIRLNHGEKQWNAVDEPHVTVTSANHSGLVAANLVRFNFDDAGIPIDKPLPTITHFNHAALVYSFLVKYFGTAIGQAVDVPLHTATSKARFGLVTVTIDGQPYVIVDIGMRMLSPRELARAQGFPDSYVLTGTKTNQVARIGNSVCPAVAKALVAANVESQIAEVA